MEMMRAFDGLKPGERLEVVSDRHPKPLLLRFSLDRPGWFEWNVLSVGPPVHRVEVVKRRHGGLRSVSEYMEADHRRLDAAYARVIDAVGRGDWAKAQRCFDEFSCGLDRHMQAEERVLYPVFEQVTGMTAGPVTVMQREHDLLRELLAAVAEALGQRDEPSLRERAGIAAQVLDLHNTKVVRAIYAHYERGLGSDAERDALVLRMQGV